MTLREFSKICQEHGFRRIGDSFCRCIGDGVFQMIDVGTKEKLPADHPLYSPTHRYERTVAIYLKSIYADCSDGEQSRIDTPSGLSLTVGELTGNPEDLWHFEGSSALYERMTAEGFAALDGIDTQLKLEAFLFARDNPNPAEPRYNYQLYDLFLACGDFYKARMAVILRFAQNCFALCSHFENRKWMSVLVPEEQLLQADTMVQAVAGQIDISAFFHEYELTWPVHREEAAQRLQKNRERNILRLRELGIDDPREHVLPV